MHRPLARGGSAERRRRSGRRRSTGRWHGGRSATRVYRRRKGGAAAERGKLRPMARGLPTGRQRRSSGCERKAGRRNVRGGAPAVGTGAGRQGDRGGTPAAGTRRVGGTAEEVRAEEEVHRPLARGGSAERRRRCGRRRSTGRWHAGQRHTKRPALPQARIRRSGLHILSVLFAEDTHCNVENRRVVQRDHTAVRPGFKMNTHTLLRLVLAPEIVADSLYVNSQFICNALRTAARQSVLDTAQLVKCDNHIR